MKYDVKCLDAIAREVHQRLNHKAIIVDRDILNCFGERLSSSQLTAISTRVSVLRAVQKTKIGS